MFDDEEDGSGVRALMARFPRAGAVTWIGLRPRRRAALEPVLEAVAESGRGLLGDHAAARALDKRQVTLIQAEHLAAVASLLGVAAIAPEACRRNLVVSGVNLLALRNRRFRVGPVLLEGTGVCAPCSRMEENLGPGGYNAMRGHGGITARVLEGGVIRRGDALSAAAGS
ncbi:MAG TPA: MOSC domain-containing protein [Pelomicrobium sp.]|nr:MOSC domain-containing protein [Pelomicrobium sp.]